jgi:CHAT domain-containing protein
MISAFLSVFAVALSTSPCDGARFITIDRSGHSFAIPKQQLIEFQEFGAEVEYREGQTWVPLALPGTRLGSHFVFAQSEQQLELRAAHTPNAQVIVRERCNAFDPADWPWLQNAQQLAERSDYSVSGQPDFATLATLRLSAKNAWQRAIVSTMHANFLYLDNQLVAAETEYLHASKLWAAEQDQARKLVMQLAAAELAYRRLSRAQTNRYLAGLDQDFAELGLDYFDARLFELRCKLDTFAAQDLRDNRCRAALVEKYRALGEQADEVNSLINLALMIRNSGQVMNLSVLQQRVAELPDIPAFHVYRGRLYLLLGLVLRDRGDFAESLVAFKIALEQFSLATEESEASIALVYGHIASIYADFGLFEQGYNTITKALHYAKSRDTPARVAVLIAQLSTLYRSDGRLQEALRMQKMALGIPSRDDTKSNTASIQIEMIEVELELGGDPKQLLMRLEMIDNAFVNEQRMLLQSRLLVRLQQFSKARKTLSTVSVQAGALVPFRLQSQSMRNALALAQSELAVAEGFVGAATSVLSARIEALAGNADTAPTSALAYLMVRSGEPIRRAWVDLQGADADIPALYRMAMLTNPARFMSPSSQSGAVRVGLKTAQGEAGFLAALFANSAAVSLRAKAMNFMTLESLQKSLPSNAQALLIMTGNKQSMVLWIAADSVRLQRLPGKMELDAQAALLRALVSTPTSASAELEQAARLLSKTMFAGQSTLPSAIWVVADEYSAALPFSVLSWPGQSQSLLETTDISLLTGLRAAPLTSSNINASLMHAPVSEVPVSGSPIRASKLLFFAPSYQGGATHRLDFASVEQALIAQISGVEMQTIAGVESTRERFLAALQSRNAWLHVSGHGKADPGVLGNAGIWFSGEKVDNFLSWLDLGNQRTHADISVLNVCQSATGALPTRQANVSFALALSASGSKHVIASLWPVSDVAASTWIPTFYRGLAQRGVSGSVPAPQSLVLENTAQALRLAQVALKHSPHYRHPFFWSSLVHFRNL